MYLKVDQPETRFGLIADTHGVFEPEVKEIFKGVHYILHAGDIGKPLILRELAAIAPTMAIIGNTDIPSWYPNVTKNAIIDAGTKRMYMLHNIDEIHLDPLAAGFHAVIYAHTHKYSAHEKNSVWRFNPGSAGPPRFLLPKSVAILTVSDTFSITQHIIR